MPPRNIYIIASWVVFSPICVGRSNDVITHKPIIASICKCYTRMSTYWCSFNVQFLEAKYWYNLKWCKDVVLLPCYRKRVNIKYTWWKGYSVILKSLHDCLISLRKHPFIKHFEEKTFYISVICTSHGRI